MYMEQYTQNSTQACAGYSNKKQVGSPDTISGQLDALESVIHDLKSDLNILNERVAPLSYRQPTPGGDGKALNQVSCRSEVAERISDSRERLLELIRLVQTISGGINH